MRPTFRILGPELAGRIVAEARAVLCGLGLEVHDEELLALLAARGARVDRDRQHVVFTPPVIDEALRTAPRSFKLYDATGAETHDLGGDMVHFAPASAALTVLDPASGTARPPTTADYVRYVRVAERLPHLAAQSTAFVPADVPEKVGDVYRLFLSLAYGTKPVITGAFSAETFAMMRDLLVCVRGDAAALRDKPLAVFTCCPTTPLKWGRISCRNIIDCARSGIPVELVAMTLAGFTSPATLTGTLIQHTAEILAGVVLHQIASPGAPLLFGTASTAFEMRYETTPSGGIESMMLSCGVAEIGKTLGLPTQAYIALSDAKAVDGQAGLETGFGAALAALAGVNSVSGPGMLDFINCFSIEKLVLDHEACGMARRLVAGIEPKEDFPAAPRLTELLAEQHLLISRHTRRYGREEQYLPGVAIDRMGRARFVEEGAPDLATRLASEVHRLEEEGRAAPVAEATRSDLVTSMRDLARAGGLALPELPA